MTDLITKCKVCKHYEPYDKCFHPDARNPYSGKPASASGVRKFGACEKNEMFSPIRLFIKRA